MKEAHLQRRAILDRECVIMSKVWDWNQIARI
jgi:hypothetical protein